MTIETKKANALAICGRIEGLKAYITDSEPELWFGGIPPLFINLSTSLGSFSTLMREKFELEALPNPNEVPSLIGATPGE